MLKIFVGPDRHKLTTIDGYVMSVYSVRVLRGEKLEFLRDCSDLAETKEVGIFFRRWRRLWLLRLCPALQKGVVEVLSRYHGKQDQSFDCYAFVNLVSGVKPHRVTDLKKHWKTKTKVLWSRVGDVVFLVNEADNCFHHAAISIGWGLYLSIYGLGGDLEVASLKDMRHDYGARRVLIATPRL